MYFVIFSILYYSISFFLMLILTHSIHDTMGHRSPSLKDLPFSHRGLCQDSLDPQWKQWLTVKNTWKLNILVVPCHMAALPEVCSSNKYLKMILYKRVPKCIWETLNAITSSWRFTVHIVIRQRFSDVLRKEKPFCVTQNFQIYLTTWWVFV